MRFIGFNYPVRVYNNVTYIREKNIRNGVMMRRQPFFGGPFRKRKSSVSEASSFGEDDLFTKLLQARHMKNPGRLQANDISKPIVEEDESHYNIYDNNFSSNEEEDMEHQLLQLEGNSVDTERVTSSVGDSKSQAASQAAQPAHVKMPSKDSLDGILRKGSSQRKKAMTKIIDPRDASAALKLNHERNLSVGGQLDGETEELNQLFADLLGNND